MVATTSDVRLTAADFSYGSRRMPLIATHGVVMDTTARVMWVSEGPHLLGRFVRFDVGRLLAKGYDPKTKHEIVATEPDPLLSTTRRRAEGRAE